MRYAHAVDPRDTGCFSGPVRVTHHFRGVPCSSHPTHSPGGGLEWNDSTFPHKTGYSIHAFRHHQTRRFPRTAPQPAPRHRRDGRRFPQAVHRRLQQLYRHHSRPRPSGQGGHIRQGVHPRGRRRAVRLQHDRRRRWHRHGTRGHEVFSAQPRDHCRRRGDGHPGPLLRRHGLHPQLRQDLPGMLMGAMRCNIPTVFVSGGRWRPARRRTARRST